MGIAREEKSQFPKGSRNGKIWAVGDCEVFQKGWTIKNSEKSFCLPSGMVRIPRAPRHAFCLKNCDQSNTKFKKCVSFVYC